MRLSCRFRRLRDWVYDQNFFGLPSLWFEYFTAKKLNRACSRNSRHNRFLPFELSIIPSRSESYRASVVATGSLWGNDSTYQQHLIDLGVVATGSLWGNDSLCMCSSRSMRVVATGSLWGNDSSLLHWCSKPVVVGTHRL